MAVGVGMETGAGVTMGLMLALGVALLPAEGLGLLLGDGVLGVGRMLAVGGSERLELTKKNRDHKERVETHCSNSTSSAGAGAGIHEGTFPSPEQDS